MPTCERLRRSRRSSGRPEQLEHVGLARASSELRARPARVRARRRSSDGGARAGRAKRGGSRAARRAAWVLLREARGRAEREHLLTLATRVGRFASTTSRVCGNSSCAARGARSALSQRAEVDRPRPRGAVGVERARELRRAGVPEATSRRLLVLGSISARRPRLTMSSKRATATVDQIAWPSQRLTPSVRGERVCHPRKRQLTASPLIAITRSPRGRQPPVAGRATDASARRRDTHRRDFRRDGHRGRGQRRAVQGRLALRPFHGPTRLGRRDRRASSRLRAASSRRPVGFAR